MTAHDEPKTTVDDAAGLRARVAELDSELVMLRDELAETNRGVLALYAELDVRAEQLQQLTELKSRFLWYTSHEFRTPLGAIRSITRILLDRLDGPLTSEQEMQLQLVQKSVIELLEMVNDQLDLAKIEAGRITVSPVWFEMVDLFSAVRGMFKPLLLNPLVQLVFEDPAETLRLYSDDKKLAQILRNFISNALKFTMEGEIVVRAIRVNNEVVEFSVTDSGIGISEENVKHIFEEFVQVDSSIQRRVRGTGLGLSLSRRLAHLLGGEVAVESSVGTGSRFSVRVPITLPETAGDA